MESKSKKLRSGYTTGACAAAAAKAATSLLLMRAVSPALNPVPEGETAEREGDIRNIDIPFPDGSRAAFRVQSSGFSVEGEKRIAVASIIKDAGDDPDVTHGAEIAAAVQSSEFKGTDPDAEIIIQGGNGVGRVTKPGLAIPVGEPAINPVPRKMIEAAVREALKEHGVKGRAQGETGSRRHALRVTISVRGGEELARKTLNHRLGIVGGISILGTTGIVKPLSEAAWTATIGSSFDVAKALGREEVVLSTGRTSEKAHQKKYGLPEECYAMMGDYTEFSLRDAKRHDFRKIHVCAQWAKMIKIAKATPQTHVRHGAIDPKDAVTFLRSLGVDVPERTEFNTVREVFDCIRSAAPDPQTAFSSVCTAAARYCEEIASGTQVTVHLVSYEGEIIAESA